MILRKRKGVRVSTRRIRRFVSKTGIGNALEMDRTGAAFELAEAHKAYRIAKKNAIVWRDEFLVSLAEAKSQKNGTTVDKELKSLRHVEYQRTQARNVKRMLRKLGTPTPIAA